MTDNSLTVQVFGLNDPGADLTIVGVCDQCGAELWRRKYVEAEFVAMGLRQLLRQVQMDVQRDRDRFAEHECVIH